MLGKAQRSAPKINVTAVVDICTILFIGSSLVFLFCSRLRSCVHVRCQLPHKIKQLFNPLFTAGGSHVLSQNSISPAYRPRSPIPYHPTPRDPATTDPYAVKTGTNTTARTDPINEQRSRAATGGHSAFDEFVAVYEVRSVDDGGVDLDHDKRIVRLAPLGDWKCGR